MKIAMPVNEKIMDSGICLSFGRAPYFLIYDTDLKKGEFLSNVATASQGGAGIQAAQMVADQKVEAVLVPKCGQNAARVFQAAKIPMYQVINGSIQENIQAFLDQKLSLLTEIHAGYHRHGGN